jgi:hypothetical protein
LNASGLSGIDQSSTGVGHARRAGIRKEGETLARCDDVYKRLNLVLRRVFIETLYAPTNAVCRQQTRAYARVFASQSI